MCHFSIHFINVFCIICLIFILHYLCLCFVPPQILANIIIFMCGNMAGAYHKHLMELALKQTYQDTCNCIKSPIKLEFEKRQQVKSITLNDEWAMQVRQAVSE